MDLAALMDGRARTYGLMARLFLKEVDKAALTELQGMRFPAATGNAKVDEGYHMLYNYLRTSWDDSITDLAIDYVRTFIGHGVNGFSAAYPFESVYTSERRLMMQEARAEVLQTLRENNLVIVEDVLASTARFFANGTSMRTDPRIVELADAMRAGAAEGKWEATVIAGGVQSPAEPQS